MYSIKKIINDFNGAGETIVAPYSVKLTGGYKINISKYSKKRNGKSNRRNFKSRFI